MKEWARWAIGVLALALGVVILIFMIAFFLIFILPVHLW